MGNKAYFNKSAYTDLLWDGVTQKQVDFLSKIKKKYFGRKKISIIDSGCGNGRLTFPISKKIRSSNILGYDPSLDMIEYAKKRNKNRKISFIKGDIREFVTNEKFDMLFCIYSPLNYILKDREIILSLECINNSLKMGGIVIVDLSNLFDFALMQKSPNRVLKFKNKNVEIIQLIKMNYDSFNEIWNHDETLLINKKTGQKIIEEHHELRYISTSELKFFSHITGFRVMEILRGYSTKKKINEHRIIGVLKKIK